MEDWEIVSIESELDRLRDEKEKSAPTGKKSGCGKLVLMFGLGIILIRVFGEFLMIIFGN
jgi:hypothetical protein